MPSPVIVGIDLAGPSNAADTALTVARVEGEGLRVEQCRIGLSDASILAMARTLADTPCVYALDAPLSYNDGGGDRPADQHLRREVMQRGLPSGSVMPPTMTRMAYLTLRGLAISRGLRAVAGDTARVIEVHPGAAMALRGAPISAVRSYAKDPGGRVELIGWLGTQGLRGLEPATAATSHQVASVGAALAGWAWSRGQSAWCWRANPPLHPFDFAC